jgi:hypothetical protein
MEFVAVLTPPPARVLSQETTDLASRLGRMLAASAAADILTRAADRGLSPDVAGRMAEMAALTALKSAARALSEHPAPLCTLMAIADLMFGTDAGVAAFPAVAEQSIAGHHAQLCGELDRVKADIERSASVAMARITGGGK